MDSYSSTESDSGRTVNRFLDSCSDSLGGRLGSFPRSLLGSFPRSLLGSFLNSLLSRFLGSPRSGFLNSLFSSFPNSLLSRFSGGPRSGFLGDLRNLLLSDMFQAKLFRCTRLGTRVLT